MEYTFEEWVEVTARYVNFLVTEKERAVRAALSFSVTSPTPRRSSSA